MKHKIENLCHDLLHCAYGSDNPEKYIENSGLPKSYIRFLIEHMNDRKNDGIAKSVYTLELKKIVQHDFDLIRKLSEVNG